MHYDSLRELSSGSIALSGFHIQILCLETGKAGGWGKDWGKWVPYSRESDVPSQRRFHLIWAVFLVRENWGDSFVRGEMTMFRGIE